MLPKTPIRQHTYTPLYKGVICCCISDGLIFANRYMTFRLLKQNLKDLLFKFVSVHGLNCISNERSCIQNLTVLEFDEASNEYRCLLHRYSCWLFLCPSISLNRNKL